MSFVKNRNEINFFFKEKEKKLLIQTIFYA